MYEGLVKWDINAVHLPFNHSFRYVYILYTYIGFSVGGILTCSGRIATVKCITFHCISVRLAHCHTVTAYGAVVLPIGTLAFSSVTSQKDDHAYN